MLFYRIPLHSQRTLINLCEVEDAQQIGRPLSIQVVRYTIVHRDSVEEMTQ